MHKKLTFLCCNYFQPQIVSPANIVVLKAPWYSSRMNERGVKLKKLRHRLCSEGTWRHAARRYQMWHCESWAQVWARPPVERPALCVDYSQHFFPCYERQCNNLQRSQSPLQALLWSHSQCFCLLGARYSTRHKQRQNYWQRYQKMQPLDASNPSIVWVVANDKVNRIFANCSQLRRLMCDTAFAQRVDVHYVYICIHNECKTVGRCGIHGYMSGKCLAPSPTLLEPNFYLPN